MCGMDSKWIEMDEQTTAGYRRLLTRDDRSDGSISLV
jgi:hypothetical protein